MKGQSCNLPSSVSVRFLSRRCSGLPSATIPAWYTKEISIASASIEGIEGHPGTKWFHDRALALFAGGGTTPTNKTVLDTLASQIAIDYYNWNKESFDESYPQIISPILDALTDTIEWEYRPNQCITRRHTAPYNGEAEEMMHNDSANAACVDSLPGTVVQKTPCFESYGPIASGSTIIQVFKNCLEDGFLVQRYSRTENLACGCEPPQTCPNLCVTVELACGAGAGPNKIGASVRLERNGVEISTETTRVQVRTVTITNAGNGYTPGSGYTISFSGGGGTGGATGTFDVNALGRVVNARMTFGGSYVTTPTVSFPGTGTGATGVATLCTCACFYSVPDGSGYKVFATLGDDYWETSSPTFSMPDCQKNIITYHKYGKLRGINIGGCGAKGEGVQVTATQGGTTEIAFVDVNGEWEMSGDWLTDVSPAIPDHHFVNISFSDPSGKFNDRSINDINLSPCFAFTTVTPDTFNPIFRSNFCDPNTGVENPGNIASSSDTCWSYGYAVADKQIPCFLPISKTLELNDPVAGLAILTWDCNIGTENLTGWFGEGSITVGDCNIPTACFGAGGPKICPGTTITIKYRLNYNGLFVSWFTHEELCTNPFFTYRCLGGGLNQSGGGFGINNFSSVSCPPAFMLEYDYDFTTSTCLQLNPYAGSSGTFSVTEA